MNFLRMCRKSFKFRCNIILFKDVLLKIGLKNVFSKEWSSNNGNIKAKMLTRSMEGKKILIL